MCVGVPLDVRGRAHDDVSARCSVGDGSRPRVRARQDDASSYLQRWPCSTAGERSGLRIAAQLAQSLYMSSGGPRSVKLTSTRLPPPLCRASATQS